MTLTRGRPARDRGGERTLVCVMSVSLAGLGLATATTPKNGNRSKGDENLVTLRHILIILT